MTPPGFLLDTNHASALWRRDAALTRKLEAHPQSSFGVCLPVIGELWYMVFQSKRVEANAPELAEFLKSFVSWQFDEACAIDFGRIKAHLRPLGKPIPDIDVQIAAIARVNQLTLLTADQHFKVVPDLPSENWLK